MPSSKKDWDKLMKAAIAKDKAEQITPWNAPVPSKISMQSTPKGPNLLSLIGGAGLPAGKTISFNQYTPPQKPNIFKRIIQSFRQPWYKSPMIYMPYILIGSMEILLIATTKGDHTSNGIALGINMGIMFMTFLKRQQEKMDERMDDIKRHIMEREAEIKAEVKIRQEYEDRYGPI